MTTEALALSSMEDRVADPEEKLKVVACAFCRRRLADEYFFACRRCGGSYCYIHMSRHQPARCAGRAGRGRRVHAAPLKQKLSEEVPSRGGNQLLLAGPAPGRGSSANV